MLVMDFTGAIEIPELAKKLMTPGKSFTDGHARELATEIVLADGDWRGAFDRMSGHSPAWLTKLRRRCGEIGGGQ